MFSIGYMKPDGSIVVMMLARVASIWLSVAIESNRPSSARALIWGRDRGLRTARGVAW